MYTYQRATDYIVLYVDSDVPTTYTITYNGITETGTVFATRHMIRMAGLASNTAYGFQCYLRDGQGGDYAGFSGMLRTLGGYKVTGLRIYADGDGYRIKVATDQPAALEVDAVTSYGTTRIYEDNVVRGEREFTAGVLPRDMEHRLVLRFHNESGELVTTCVLRTRATFDLAKIPAVFTHLFNAVQIYKEYTGSLLLGITAYLNNVKVILRGATLADYESGAGQLTDAQRQAFEDQMSYYYATAVSQDNPLVLVQKAYEWFVYDNVDNLDTTAPPLTRAQKAAIIQILKQVADNVVLTATVSQIKQTIRKLNALELAPATSALRNAYNALSATPLEQPGVIDYAGILFNEPVIIDTVESA